MIKIKIEIKSRRGESNFMSAIKSIIDADMTRQQRVNGILKDFYYSKSIFVFRSSVNIIGTEGKATSFYFYVSRHLKI